MPAVSLIFSIRVVLDMRGSQRLNNVPEGPQKQERRTHRPPAINKSVPFSIAGHGAGGGDYGTLFKRQATFGFQGSLLRATPHGRIALRGGQSSTWDMPIVSAPN